MTTADREPEDEDDLCSNCGESLLAECNCDEEESERRWNAMSQEERDLIIFHS